MIIIKASNSANFEADSKLEYKRVLKPKFMLRRKQVRLTFAEKCQFWEEDWKRVIFSNEKTIWFGSQMYCHDKRKKKEKKLPGNFGYELVMVWAAIGVNGRAPICYISTKMNSQSIHKSSYWTRYFQVLVVIFLKKTWYFRMIMRQFTQKTQNRNIVFALKKCFYPRMARL